MIDSRKISVGDSKKKLNIRICKSLFLSLLKYCLAIYCIFCFIPVVEGITCSRSKYFNERWSYSQVLDKIFPHTSIFGCRLFEIKSSCFNDYVNSDERRLGAMKKYFDSSLDRKEKRALDYTLFLEPGSESFKHYCSNDKNEVHRWSSDLPCPSTLRRVAPLGVSRCPNYKSLRFSDVLAFDSDSKRPGWELPYGAP